MDSGAYKGLLLAVIALYVISILIQATAPSAITSFSNTSAISGYTANGTLTGGYTGWASSTTAAWGTLPDLYIVIVVIILIAIVVSVIGML